MNIQRGGVYSNGVNDPRYQLSIDPKRIISKFEIKYDLPKLMALDDNGNIVVACALDNCIMVYNRISGNFIRKIGERGNENGKFNGPTGVAFDGNGNIIVADTYNKRVQVLRYIDGKHVLTIEGGENDYPCSVAIDKNNNVLVHTGKIDCCIKVYKLSDGTFIRQICTKGSNPGQLKGNGSIIFDKLGNIVVADGENNRVQILKYEDGSHIRTIQSSKMLSPCGIALDFIGHIIVTSPSNNQVDIYQYNNGHHLMTFIRGKNGYAPMINNPYGVVIDNEGYILVGAKFDIFAFKYGVNIDNPDYVSPSPMLSPSPTPPAARASSPAPPDAFTKVEPYTRPPQNAAPPLQKYFVYDGINHPEYTIGKVSLTGDTKFSKLGNETFSEPALMVLDDQGNIVLVDTGNKCIKVINPVDGSVMRTIGVVGKELPQLGVLVNPIGIAFANANQIIVSDKFNINSSQLVVFEYSSGKQITSVNFHRDYTAYGIAVRDGYVFAPSDNGIYVFNINDGLIFTRKIRNRGTGPGQLGGGNNIVFDKNGNIVLADSDNKRIQIIKPDGTIIKSFNTRGVPNGIIVDSENNIIVTETDTKTSFSCVSVYNQKGTKLKTYGKFGTSIGEFQNPFGIAINTAGNIFVSDKNNNRIIKIY